MAPREPTSFADLLQRHRAAAGLTQEALAERAGLSARGVSDLERGRRRSPYYDTVGRLADALGLAGEARSRLLAAARSGATPTADALEFPSDLPTPTTALLGRDEDVRAVARLLGSAAVRLVTLTGPGGVGKSRLALAVAADQAPAFPDGVRFVPLAALRDPALVPATIAHGLGLAETAEPPLARLAAYLHPKRLLLVLDNCEHLLPAAPDLGALLAACPRLVLMATSRAPLRLVGEHEYAVAPLALPEPRRPAAWEALRAAPATALFLARLAATAARPPFGDEDAAAVAMICARLDGLPLAIELAAARGRALTPRELAARLTRRLPLLSHGQRDLPARQRTLRDAIAWSYDLLGPDAQRLLRWLAAFAGGWSLEGAEALCAGWEQSPGAVLDGLDALVESSLVRAGSGADGRSRFGMLETIREFAAEALAASGEEAVARQRHADVVLAYTDRAERGLQSAERTAWSRGAAEELENVRAALRWSLDHGGAERALRIVGNLDWFWDAVARDGEGWAWSQAALAQPDADRAGWGYARAVNAAGAIAWNVGDFAASGRLLTEAVARFRSLGDRRSLGQALTNLALTMLYQGDADAASRLAAEGVALLETVDDPWNRGLARFALGETLLGRDADGARAAYERSLAAFRAVGEPWGIALAITGLGGLAMRQRDYGRARTLLEEGLALRRSVGNVHAVAISLVSLGELARREGDDARAAAHLEEGLAGFRDLGDAEHVAWALHNLGLVAARRGEITAAAAALAECLALRATQGNAAKTTQTLAAVAGLALQTGDVEAAARLWGATEALRAARGVAAPADEDGDDERRTLDRLCTALGAAAGAIFTEGRALPPAAAVRRAQQALAVASRPAADCSEGRPAVGPSEATHTGTPISEICHTSSPAGAARIAALSGDGDPQATECGRDS